jgi:phosphoribosylformylglycinamidine cyclo-ligase
MKNTFNMGIGYALVVSAADSNDCIEIMKKAGYNAYAVGEMKKGGEGVRYA